MVPSERQLKFEKISRNIAGGLDFEKEIENFGSGIGVAEPGIVFKFQKN